MKNKWLFCMLFVAAELIVAGCGNYAARVETDEEFRYPDEAEEETFGESTELYEAVEKENKKKTQETVVSEDGTHQMVIPSGWTVCEDKLNNTMMFELQGETDDQYIGVLVLSENAYGDFDIKSYVDAYEDNIREQFEQAILGETMAADIHGNQGYTFTVTGTVEEIEYINHVYAVDYEGEKVIFTASTYAENESSVLHDLEELVYSFEPHLIEN